MKKAQSRNTRGIKKGMTFTLLVLLAALAGHLSGKDVLRAQAKAPLKSPSTAQIQAARQSDFSTPEEAMQAVTQAAMNKDRASLTNIFGPDASELLSGDPVEDEKDLQDFAAAVEESAVLRKDTDTKYTLVVGKDNWPFPVPIVKRENRWILDTPAGIKEILNRRIGENELSAIATARAYVVAQWEYFTEGDWDHDGVAEYARKFRSSPGQHDGLYWEAAEGEKLSPLGKLVSAARAEGYGAQASANTNTSANTKNDDSRDPGESRNPYHGYYFKILTAQGAHAPGGKYNYIINGNMIAGYALVAYPDKWGNSGVMTFIVNQQGRVYQKNLGVNTAKLAPAMTDYNPDPTWKLVPE